ncbi:conserved hypothetical protein [Carnobacterium maltaromaticum]|nr:conserved hypothetical protein [Carnobacterium maltaromaticum]
MKRMFEKVVGVLSENSSDDYFYDDEFIYVQELLRDFSDNDWEKLFQSVKSKGDKYKIRLVYCIDDDFGMNGLKLLFSLLDENDEVVEYVIDSLRSFKTPEYKELINSNNQIIEKAESLLKNAIPPVKRVLEAFIEENKR